MAKYLSYKRRAIASIAISWGAAIGLSALLAVPALAATETILHTFTGEPDGYSGYYPQTFNLIEDPAGNLYGVTPYGGFYDWGMVFELSLQDGAWVETMLHSFGAPGDGGVPEGSLIMDKAGNLYGVLEGYKLGGVGAVYELSPDGKGNWTETILTPQRDVHEPFGGLALDADGNLYGVTQLGGSLCQTKPKPKMRCGVVFELSPPAKGAKKDKWKYTVIHDFLGQNYGDGQWPNGNLILDGAGNLYGTTQYGGAYNKGTAFELSPGPDGWTEAILHDFGSFAGDGLIPFFASLTSDIGGNLYGTTWQGGSSGGGTVFELSPNGGSWTETVLYSFSGNIYPMAPVTFYNSKLYGTTFYGGTANRGTVFELSLSGGVWIEKILYSFGGAPGDGEEPNSGVIPDSQGNLFGVTGGGADYAGIVYKISQ